jgi:hypothetical protein
MEYVLGLQDMTVTDESDGPEVAADPHSHFSGFECGHSALSLLLCEA